ncbi:14388_t:CDS:2 [Funneliformis mosseae]|uniref:14388_t:CDS:1 n=1 Tax=Funneliformis mosseae TaxID=27381 RepID=A0A9N8VU77_FUNMO|nr:14388_t:CDS:2 [Funneliformis mosseae]
MSETLHFLAKHLSVSEASLPLIFVRSWTSGLLLPRNRIFSESKGSQRFRWNS